jgi:hypothetical protein
MNTTYCREASSRVLHRSVRSEWLDIVEGSAPSETKVETSEAHHSEKKVIFELLAPYQETTRE